MLRSAAATLRWSGPAWKAMLAAVAMGGSLLAPGAARAMSAGGITMPDSMDIAGQHLRLNGMGVRLFTILHIRGYVAGLYVTTQSHDPASLLAQPGAKVLRIEFARAAGVGRVQDEYRRGHVMNCVPACSKSEEAGFGQLLDSVRPVRQGDITTFIFLPNEVDVLFDDRNIATIPGAEFSHHLLASFLGQKPPSTALRDGLLGAGAG